VLTYQWASLLVSSDRAERWFLEFSGGFVQLAESLTRGRNVVDPILTNEPLFVCDVSVT